jgi:mRNA interferase YafQ
MLKIRYPSQFKKDVKKLKGLGKKGKIIFENIMDVAELLANIQQLPEKYLDHQLTGNYKNFKECYISPDRLLIYKININELELLLFRTGSHSELFK